MMQNQSKLRTAIALLSLLASACALAAQTNQTPTASPNNAYSATAIHRLPDQTETSGKVIKSGQNMRLEFDQNGQSVIQILRPTDGVMYILNPADQTYVEIRGQAVPAVTTDAYTPPCVQSSQTAQCERIGTDTVSGITVERWLIASQPQTKPLVVLWDSTRRRALRQEFPDGGVMAMTFKAMEDVNGRRTEHWLIETSVPNQPSNTSSWWFDPELRVVVREDLPGGEVRRLEQITVAPVDAALFQVPDGWQQQDPQATAPASE